MGKRTDKKMRIAVFTAVSLVLLVLIGILAYWKIPSRRESMTWARTLEASDVAQIKMTVMPSSEEERYRSFEEEAFEDVVSLINQST